MLTRLIIDKINNLIPLSVSLMIDVFPPFPVILIEKTTLKKIERISNQLYKELKIQYKYH